MRLLTATQIVDRTNLRPVANFTTIFTEDGTNYAFTTVRTTTGITAELRADGMGEPFTQALNPEQSPTQQAQKLAEWIVFVVDMTLTIRQMTNA